METTGTSKKEPWRGLGGAWLAWARVASGAPEKFVAFPPCGGCTSSVGWRGKIEIGFSFAARSSSEAPGDGPSTSLLAPLARPPDLPLACWRLLCLFLQLNIAHLGGMTIVSSSRQRARPPGGARECLATRTCLYVDSLLAHLSADHVLPGSRLPRLLRTSRD